jgi:GNAT superfamily N-acetyltransferase
MAKSNFHFYKIKDLESNDAKKAFNLYLSTAQKFEPYPVEMIVNILKTDPHYMLYIAKKDEQFVGFALLYFFDELKICFLDFMAVISQMQGKGIGTFMIQCIIKKVLRDAPDFVGIIFLVLQENAENGYEKEIRKKRIRFYFKEGAKKFENFVFLLPPDGKKKAYLMILPIRSVTSFSKRRVIEYINAIYHIYQNENSELINKITQNLPPKIRLV